MEAMAVSNDASKAFPSAPETRIICRVCEKQFSQYTCPRCNTRYCSLPCYKNHSLHCTESFMRENVEEELRQMKPEEETKQKMLEILKRFNSEEAEEVDSFDDGHGFMLSEKTIQKFLSGNQVRLEDLSPEEMKHFQRAIASGELSKMIEPWTPWWSKLSAKEISLSRAGAQLIRPAERDQETSVASEDNSEDSSEDNSEGQFGEVPPGPEAPLTPVSKLIKTQPSLLLTVHLVDIIYSYCFTLRLYNGDWQSDAVGAAMVILSISTVLGESSQPETVGEALICCLERSCSPSYRHMGGFRFGLNVMEDVVRLLSLGSNALVCALCDLERLIQSGVKELKLDQQRHHRKGEASKLRSAERKVYFMMCWAHEQPGEAWSALATIVGTEKVSFSTAESSMGKPSEIRASSDSKRKGLIEEMG
ncbi:hypothetical protein H6P81_004715 [Aristolochia fimbriata]|uniref:HIT-type domain-containing protein n=1 Tax=Aristolochia fimbriata TaxID=158543 RepID=A0AAV7EVD9_ARIFI|nr:hypothetical protein H6P81_004715 [Aristolochia fimbriata]